MPWLQYPMKSHSRAVTRKRQSVTRGPVQLLFEWFDINPSVWNDSLASSDWARSKSTRWNTNSHISVLIESRDWSENSLFPHYSPLSSPGQPQPPATSQCRESGCSLHNCSGVQEVPGDLGAQGKQEHPWKRPFRAVNRVLPGGDQNKEAIHYTT